MIRHALLYLMPFMSASGQFQFAPQVIDNKVEIGYGVAVGDVDGDKRPDILLADKKQFVWYRNGDWKRFVMVEDLTSSDNVCIAARDIDGDGRVEVAVGAQWNPGETSDTLKSGSVHYLVRPDDPTQKWIPIPLHHEPTVHRMRWVKAAANQYHLIVLPLHGRGNKDGNGLGVKVLAYVPAKNSTSRDQPDQWKYLTIDQSMHLTHNLDAIDEGRSEAIYIGGKEGVKRFLFDGKNWAAMKDNKNLISGRSFGEVRLTKGTSGQMLAGIEPMHGNELTLYKEANKGWSRTVLASDLNQGHALAIMDMTGDGKAEVIAGWRDPNKQGKTGIKIFVSSDEGSWKEHWIDDNGIACEDLQVADLNDDGKPDIVAAGRSSHNLKIYWNK